MLRLTMAPDLTGRLRAVWLTVACVDHDERPGLREEIETAQAAMMGRWEGLRPSEIPQLRPGRELYRAVGMDPTRTRPSSEALLRRVLQGKGLYRLDPIVDTGNLFSLVSGLPLGLYDMSVISGDCALRFGREGEGYAGIRKDRVNVSGRLCIADDEGPFGSPSSDSHRCRVREETSGVLTLLYAPISYPGEKLLARGEELAAAFARWNGGSPGEPQMLPAAESADD
jgi:DNA/RNA-binding domain of Phe-tRNA-synthetase-like protein